MIFWQEKRHYISCGSRAYIHVSHNMRLRVWLGMKLQYNRPHRLHSCHIHRHLLFFPHIAKIDIYSDGEAVITKTFIILLGNSEKTADACMLNILILLLVAFELSLFSLFIVPPALSRSLSSQVAFFTVRFTFLLSSSSFSSSPVLSPSSYQLSPSGWGRGRHCCPWIWSALPTSVPRFLLPYRGRWRTHSKLNALWNITDAHSTHELKESWQFACASFSSSWNKI